jgi:uncharacterized protein YjbJ (UPF0337 family)
MNRDILEGKWKQLRGKIREKWGKLTDDELDKAQGRFDKLSGLIQEKYGYAKEKAEEELNRFLEHSRPESERRVPEKEDERR